MLSVNARLVEQAKIVTGLAPITPSTSTPDYVSLKNYERVTAIIIGDNATTVTGSAITLKQATAVAGTGEKALSFTRMSANADTATNDTLVETAVTSDTFTTVATNNLNYLYIIDVEASDLDMDNGFDCFRVGTGDATATVLSVIYVLWPKRYAGVDQSATVD